MSVVTLTAETRSRPETCTRFVDMAPNLREDPSDGYIGTLAGHFCVFNRWSEIRDHAGHYMERIAPGACAKTFAERRDRIKCLFQHGRDPSVGMKPLGPVLELEEDAVGGRYTVGLLDTSYNRDLLPALKSPGGSLCGASFRFEVVRDQVTRKPPRSSHNPLGIEERTITEMRLHEFGPVTFPAYAEATAAARSLNSKLEGRQYLRGLADALAERTGPRRSDGWLDRPPALSPCTTRPLMPLQVHLSPSARAEVIKIGGAFEGGEAAGLLFGPYEPVLYRPITVSAVSSPGPNFESERSHHRVDELHDLRMIAQAKTRGLHLVGSFHTHLASRSPSESDAEIWKQERMRHHLKAYVGLLVVDRREEVVFTPWNRTADGLERGVVR